jgi:hypothetical protein
MLVCSRSPTFCRSLVFTYAYLCFSLLQTRKPFKSTPRTAGLLKFSSCFISFKQLQQAIVIMEQKAQKKLWSS